MIRQSAGYAPAPMPDARATTDAPLVPDAPQGAAPAQRERSRSLRGLLTLLMPALYLLTKLKFLLLFGKLGLTGLSMLISVWAYAALWGLGWAAAVGFVALLFVHEMGHWLMMRAKGVPATAPVFIPFLGAVIGMRAMPRSVQDEAVIGIAGPIAGTAGAFAWPGPRSPVWGAPVAVAGHDGPLSQPVQPPARVTLRWGPHRGSYLAVAVAGGPGWPGGPLSAPSQSVLVAHRSGGWSADHRTLPGPVCAHGPARLW